MDVVAALVGFVGLCMVGLTGIFALLSAGDRRMVKLLRRTPPTPIGSWHVGQGLVSAEGVTGYGAAGPQTGPLSGERCVWYEMTLVRVSTSDRAD